MSGKPDVKVFLKGRDGGGFVDLAAFWRNERGMLSGKLDRSVIAIKVQDRDGRERVIRPDERGYVDGFFVNIRIEGEQVSAPRDEAPRGRSQRERRPADDMPDDNDIDGEDPIPF